MNIPFSSRLSSLRTNARLTNDELASLAKVPRSLIPGLQSGKRRIGEMQARRIGSALKLTGSQLDEFVFHAINNCSEKVLEESKNYPAELLNVIARQLRKNGILAESINGCSITGDDSEQEVMLTIGDGSKAKIKTQLQYA